MDRHARYLELRLDRCLARPELHRHQIPVLRELIALARSGVSPAEYNRRAGHLFGLVRAEWLDRYDNLADIHTALGNERGQRASAVARKAAVATTFAEFAAAMQRATARVAAIELAAANAADALMPLVVNLLYWATEAAELRREPLAALIKGLWRTIQQNDPGCSWQRICSYPPYRNRLPFGDDALAMLGAWLDEAVGPQLVDVPEVTELDPGPLPVIDTPDDPPLPSVADAARGYHMAYDYTLQHGPHELLEVYERIFEVEAAATCANDFLCRMLEADLPCELVRVQHRAIARDALDHCRGLSQPSVEYHYRSLGDALAAATTTTTMEYELARHEAFFAVESAWNHILIAYAFRTIVAAMTCELDPSPARRETVRRSYDVSSQLFGDWDTAFAIDRVWSFFASVFFELGQTLVEPPPIVGAMRGEVGLDVLSAFRAHALEHVIEFVSGQGLESTEALDAKVERLVNSRRFATAEDMRDHVTALFRAAMAGQPAPAPKKPASPGVVLWGQDVLFEALEAALSSPPRPC